MKKFVHQRLNETIEKYGWLITGVPGGAIYTVGLVDKFSHPEMMIHDLSPGMSEDILRVAVERVSHGYDYILTDSLHDNVIVGFNVKSIPVDKSNFGDWLGQAADYHKDDFQAVQLLWPDAGGLFPGDEGFQCKSQLRFDVRRPEYDAMEERSAPGQLCAVCGQPIDAGHDHDIKIKSKPCPICSKVQEFSVSARAFDEWQRGKKIQDAFPRLTKANREALITGLCEECWAKVFDKEEE